MWLLDAPTALELAWTPWSDRFWAVRDVFTNATNDNGWTFDVQQWRKV